MKYKYALLSIYVLIVRYEKVKSDLLLALPTFVAPPRSSTTAYWNSNTVSKPKLRERDFTHPCQKVSL